MMREMAQRLQNYEQRERERNAAQTQRREQERIAAQSQQRAPLNPRMEANLERQNRIEMDFVTTMAYAMRNQSDSMRDQADAMKDQTSVLTETLRDLTLFSRVDNPPPIMTPHMDPNYFLSRFENCARVNNWPENIKSRMCVRYLNQSVNEMLAEDYNDLAELQWSDLRQLILDRFDTPDNQLENRQKAFSVRQEEEETAYGFYLRALGRFKLVNLPSGCEVIVIDTIIRGLKRTVRMQILDKGDYPRTLDQLQSRLRQIEILNRSKWLYDRPGDHSQESKKNDYLKNLSNEEAVKPGQQFENQVMFQKNVTCYNCFQPGHKSNVCPYKETSQNTDTRNQTNFGNYREDLTCYSCYARGHNAKNCPNQETIKNFLYHARPQPYHFENEKHPNQANVAPVRNQRYNQEMLLQGRPPVNSQVRQEQKYALQNVPKNSSNPSNMPLNSKNNEYNFSVPKN